MRCQLCQGTGRIAVYAVHTIMVHQTPVAVPAETYRLEPCHEWEWNDELLWGLGVPTAKKGRG